MSEAPVFDDLYSSDNDYFDRNPNPPRSPIGKVSSFTPLLKYPVCFKVPSTKKNKTPSIGDSKLLALQISAINAHLDFEVCHARRFYRDKIRKSPSLRDQALRNLKARLKLLCEVHMHKLDIVTAQFESAKRRIPTKQKWSS